MVSVISTEIAMDERPLADSPIRAGNLEVRLAASEAELHALQRLRYRVFVEEMGAVPTAEMQASGRDMDAYDAVCDHLLVIEHGAEGENQVVGSYRLLRREPMRKIGRFYSATEFDISPVLDFPGEILELGRSCVEPAYRNRAVMQLLWRGIGAYLELHKIDLMFGCGSLYGADIDRHKETLTYLYHYHLAPEALRIHALPERYVAMDLLPKDQLNAKQIFAGLPALIKGYLRAGGLVGDGAVLDHEYNTTDVAIIVKTQAVTAKYVERYASAALKETIQGEQ